MLTSYLTEFFNKPLLHYSIVDVATLFLFFSLAATLVTLFAQALAGLARKGRA